MLDNFEQIIREEIRGHMAFDTMASEAVHIVKEQMNIVMEQVGNSLSVITGEVLSTMQGFSAKINNLMH